MKFARYLQDTQTPEWKRAYIDYRGLKKRITAIRKWHESRNLVASPSDSQTHLPGTPEPEEDVGERIIEEPSSSRMHHDAGMGMWELSERTEQVSRKTSSTRLSQTGQRKQPATANQSTRPRTNSSVTPRKPKSQSSRGFLSRGARQSTRPFADSIPMHALLPLLSPVEAAFFNTLDAELEKIEKFYFDREKAMQARTKLLEEQLNELNYHRQQFHAAHDTQSSRWSVGLNFNLVSKLKGDTSKRHTDTITDLAETRNEEKSSSEGHTSDIEDRPSNSRRTSSNRAERARAFRSRRAFDPDEYQNARKKLKKAVLEHYRGLEMLHNYRVLNITGFRKALKKFEKVTKIPAQHAYMTERVETSGFASDKALRVMMAEMEELFASRFARGDKKRAMTRLRASSMYKSHHFSTFRTGLLLGLAVPALVSGLVQSFQPETRASIPGWDALLFLYGVLLIPVLFSLLVGLNLLVWSRARINYVFIFELDTRTRLDHREYFEIPSLLLATLCYAFWLSFTRVGAPGASPHIWPLVWLGFAAVTMFDPFNVSFKSSRFWLIKNLAKLFLSGTRRVEFTDFWMGDQICSLTFTLSDLYIFACVYARDFENWRKCGSTSNAWPAAFVLAILPLLARVVQSIKRYADSKLITHLINGGKYGSGIIYYLCYYIWRHQGSSTHTASFAAWCLFGTIYSAYAAAWDFWMDWSLLRPHVKYPLLRTELIYSNYIYSYYFAIITNLLIRFIWVIYIPVKGPDMYVRLFIVGFLEMLRRCQWNFFRLENEHLGNMDQYRVTREVPLPYSFDETIHDVDDSDEQDGHS